MFAPFVAFFLIDFCLFCLLVITLGQQQHEAQMSTHCLQVAMNDGQDCNGNPQQPGKQKVP